MIGPKAYGSCTIAVEPSATGQENSIIHVAVHPGESRLEKSFALKPLRGKTLLLLSGDNNADLLCVRTEDADRQIVANPVRPENPERIGMRPGQEKFQFVDGHAGDFEGTHGTRVKLSHNIRLGNRRSGSGEVRCRRSKRCHPEPRRRRGTSPTV